MQTLGDWQVEETGSRQLQVQRLKGKKTSIFFSEARLRGVKSETGIDQWCGRVLSRGWVNKERRWTFLGLGFSGRFTVWVTSGLESGKRWVEYLLLG